MPLRDSTTPKQKPITPSRSTLDVGAFPLAVYKLVRKIPKGKVATYGQLAALLGRPRHARHVGTALAATPENVQIPWHRVVNAQGRISLRLKHWNSGSDDLQRIRLEDEGVVFSADGKINLKRFLWQPNI